MELSLHFVQAIWVSWKPKLLFQYKLVFYYVENILEVNLCYAQKLQGKKKKKIISSEASIHRM